MSDMRYRRNAGSVYSLKVHLVWCPKYRRNVFTDDIAEELRSLLYQKARGSSTPLSSGLVNGGMPA